ncbi:ABC transporter ATP-binding protein [Streptomyces scabiei]|nr:ABC transporter ATP-binding protein [Streptomyces scabiei]
MRSSLPGTSTPPPAAEPTPNAPSSSASTASHDQTGRPGQTPGPWDKQWLDTVIRMVGLADRLKHRPAQLSGGQQQRVAVARALASRPDIIFGDEPTGNLDSRSGAEVLGFLRNSVRELGQTVVMVTHDPVAAAYADRVVFLADGRLVDEIHEPTADSVLDRMKRFDSKGRTS